MMARRRGNADDDGGAREVSPLVMEEVEFVPRRRCDHGKRKAVASGSRNTKRSKAKSCVTAGSRERTGVVFRSPSRRGRSDLNTEDCSVLSKGKDIAGENATTESLGKHVGDLGSEFLYKRKTGKKCMVKHFDCSLHSAPIATCLLEGIVLDGDKEELGDEDLGTTLETMDMACCLFLVGYDKLKNTVQRVDNVESSVGNAKEELVSMRAAWEADRKELMALRKKHQDAVDEKSLLVSSMIDLREKLGVVTEYAKHCQSVARKAQGVYDRVCGDYTILEEMYFVVKEERDRGAIGTNVLVLPGDASNIPSTSAAPVERADAPVDDKHITPDA